MARPQPGQAPPEFDGRSEIQEIQVAGDWAFLWSRLTVVAKPPGGAPPVTRAGHTLTIFHRQNGRWLLARDANMLSAVPG
jgi:ketosteroid isomerase-like protein